ncbi:MAG TPA: hypothetical protein VF228_12815 [Iamia sp.]
MRMRTRLTAAALVAATALGLAAAPGSPAGADETPVPAGKASSKTFSFGGFSGDSPYNTETFVAPGSTPIIGQFAGSSADDILWYTAGNGGDALWTNTGSVQFSTSAASIGGTYAPKVGTFAPPDGYDDVLWYSTTAASQLWDYNAGGTVTKTALPAVTGPGQIVIGDFALDGIDDVIRYRPGTASDSWWDFQTMQAVARPFNVNGTYMPLVGEFAADGSSDILWYAAGVNPDFLWDFDGGGAKTEWDLSINGTYTPVVGLFSGDSKDDVIWYRPGSGADAVWDFYGLGYETKGLTVNGTYSPVACRCLQQGSVYEDVVWYRAGALSDAAWKVNGEPFAYATLAADVPGVSIAGHGTFSGDQELLLVRH